ncbi:MAG: FG-GAP repeat domain-containing protein [Verrucomicrobiales bacterium]
MELNGDGKADILSGCYSEHQPMAGLFWLLAGTGDGTVAKAVAVNGSDGKPLIIPASENEIVKSICTQPAAHDWDGDGDLDILTGNFEGTFFLFRNEGSKEKASFNPKPQQIMAGEQPLKLDGGHSGVCAVDWDGDGDADILTGSARGGAFLAENKSSGKGVVQFSPFRELLGPASGSADEDAAPPLKAPLPTNPGNNTRVWAADVNGDKRLDLLIGDSARLTARAEGVSEEEFRKRQTSWQKEMSDLREQMSKPRADGTPAPPEVSRNYSKLYERRKEFIKEESTGFVWLALRK